MSIVKAVQQDGDTVTWTIEVANPSVNPCKDTRVVFTIPTGVSLTGPAEGGFPEIVVPQGSFDASTNTWWIGEIGPGVTLSVDFIFTVDDITQADPLTGYFELAANITSLCNETDETDNLVELVIKVGQACDDDVLSIGDGEDIDTNISIG